MENKPRINVKRIQEIALDLIMNDDLEYELYSIYDNNVISPDFDIYSEICRTLKECMAYYDKLIKNMIKTEANLIEEGNFEKQRNLHKGPLLSPEEESKQTELRNKLLKKPDNSINLNILDEYRNKQEIPILIFVYYSKIYPKNSGKRVRWIDIKNAYEGVVEFERKYKSINYTELPKKSGSFDDRNASTNYNNKFNGIDVKIVKDFFDQLATHKSKNGRCFLEQDKVDLFVEKVICENDKIDKIAMNYERREKGFIIKLFYKFYRYSTDLSTGTENGVQVRDKYIHLLTDNFVNFNFVSVKNNFNHSAEIVRVWSFEG